MRHKYVSRAIVLARSPLAEQAVLLTLLTPDLGLIRARAEGLRKPSSKLTHALQTLSESDVTFVRGKDGWRVVGAILVHNWCGELALDERLRASRINGLILRLVHGEVADSALFDEVQIFIRALAHLHGEDADAAECLAALRLIRVLGLDAGDLPAMLAGYEPEALSYIQLSRKEIVSRVNRGLAASGL